MANLIKVSRHRVALATIAMVAITLLSGCPDGEAKRRAQQAKEDAERATQQVLAEADRLAKDWQPRLVEAAKDAKDELDKVLPSKTEYELVFAAPEEGSEKLRAHEARLKKMDRVVIKGLTVGYEQREDCSLGGKSFERHFRATWVSDSKVIGVSYYSKQKVDAVAFVELLQKLVPISSEVFWHVQLKRGE